MVWGRTGSQYVGSFLLGRPNGEGLYVYGPHSKQPGARYAGAFVDGVLHVLRDIGKDVGILQGGENFLDDRGAGGGRDGCVGFRVGGFLCGAVCEEGCQRDGTGESVLGE